MWTWRIGGEPDISGQDCWLWSWLAELMELVCQ